MYRFREREREREFYSDEVAEVLGDEMDGQLDAERGRHACLLRKTREREREEGGKDEKRRDSTFVGFMVFC